MRTIQKFLDDKAGLRVALVDATEAVREMRKVQNTSPVATLLVGRAMVGATLLASHLKDGEMVSLYFSGNGPIGKVFAEASFEGGVRGYAAQSQVDVPLVNNQLNLGAAIGRGLLSVVRTHPKRKTPHRGTVEIQTGEIGEDIAFYLQQSEQARSAIALGVKVDATGHVEAAGGILIELLPLATVHIEIIVEDQFMHAGSISDAIARGESAEEIIDRFLGGFQLREIPHAYELAYTCKCSRNRLLRAMELFPEKDLDDILEKKTPVMARCEFCGREYSLELAEISDIRKRRFHTGKH
jgi:molecular chaperone Hsp33